MMNKIYYALVCLCLLVCIGCKDNKQKEFNIKMIDNDSKCDGGMQGWKDGSNGFAYGYGYNDKLTYNYPNGYVNESEQDMKDYQEHYSRGYKIGYDQAYAKAKKEYDSKHQAVQTNGNGGSQYNEVVTVQSTPNTYSSPSSSDETDFHDWEEDEIKGFYIEIEDCKSEEQAEYISNQYYLGDYMEVYGRFFAKTSVKNGTYEAEIGEKVSSKMFKIKGTDLFVLFKWLPNASRWDEGVLDVWNNKGSFYKKPN